MMHVPDEWSYSHLLGFYLGDGCYNPTAKQLVVTLDTAYPDVIEDCVTVMGLTMLDRLVHVNRHRVHNSVRVVCYSPDWPALLPQHGPGRKHERPIILEPWQQDIVSRQPRAFLRGLVFSDGCRTVNRFKVKLPSGRVGEYAYPRYFFSNLSADIRRLFCATCEQLGVRWTQSNPRNISVSHRDSVAVLDEFIGPKT